MAFKTPFAPRELNSLAFWQSFFKALKSNRSILTKKNKIYHILRMRKSGSRFDISIRRIISIPFDYLLKRPWPRVTKINSCVIFWILKFKPPFWSEEFIINERWLGEDVVLNDISSVVPTNRKIGSLPLKLPMKNYPIKTWKYWLIFDVCA